MKRWPKKLVMRDAIGGPICVGYIGPTLDDEERVYALQPLPKKRKRRKAGKSK